MQFWVNQVGYDLAQCLRYTIPYAAGGKFDHNKKMQKTWKYYWNPGKWVLIWEYSARAIQWTPTWQGLDGFQKSLHHCALDVSTLSIGRAITHLCKHCLRCCHLLVRSDYFPGFLNAAEALYFPLSHVEVFVEECPSKVKQKLLRSTHRYLNTLTNAPLRWFQQPQIYFLLGIDNDILNPLTLRPAKTGLTNLEIYYLQKHFLENKWRRNVYSNPNFNSPSNIL